MLPFLALYNYQLYANPQTTDLMHSLGGAPHINDFAHNLANLKHILVIQKENYLKCCKDMINIFSTLINLFCTLNYLM